MEFYATLPCYKTRFDPPFSTLENSCTKSEIWQLLSIRLMCLVFWFCHLIRDFPFTIFLGVQFLVLLFCCWDVQETGYVYRFKGVCPSSLNTVMFKNSFHLKSRCVVIWHLPFWRAFFQICLINKHDVLLNNATYCDAVINTIFTKTRVDLRFLKRKQILPNIWLPSCCSCKYKLVSIDYRVFYTLIS